MKFLDSLLLFVFSASYGWGDLIEPSAWQKQVPQDKGDLVSIQNQLQTLLPDSKQALVAIESNDGAGSGVIVSADGLVLTAAHVIGTSDKRMTIRLPDGRTAKAVSLGGSEISDAGMLKILDEGPWPHAKMANSGKSKIGDWCFGLGHPGGFDEARGIVVRIGRIIQKSEETMQTDSRLLGGDSGGPLFDFEGKVIAIHSRISQQADQNYHVPIESFHANWSYFQNHQLLTIDNIEEGGFLGVACEESEEGLLIINVVQDSAADIGGLMRGDILLRVDDQIIKNRERLTISISSKKPGEEVKLEFKRDGSIATLKVNLGSRIATE